MRYFMLKETKKNCIEQLVKQKKNLFVGDWGDLLCDYSDGYICDAFSEIADGQTDIYYYNLKNDLLFYIAYIDEVNYNYYSIDYNLEFNRDTYFFVNLDAALETLETLLKQEKQIENNCNKIKLYAIDKNDESYLLKEYDMHYERK